MINVRLTDTTKYRQLYKVLKDEGTVLKIELFNTKTYPSLASVAEWQTDVCPVQGTRQATRRGRGWEGFCPHFSWDSNYVSRDLVSDIRGGFFFIIWQIDIRNKEQLKLLLRLLILDSFPAISEDFKSIFAFKRPTQNNTARKKAHINYNFKFNICLFSSYWKYEIYIF